MSDVPLLTFVIPQEDLRNSARACLSLNPDGLSVSDTRSVLMFTVLRICKVVSSFMLGTYGILGRSYLGFLAGKYSLISSAP